MPEHRNGWEAFSLSRPHAYTEEAAGVPLGDVREEVQDILAGGEVGEDFHLLFRVANPEPPFFGMRASRIEYLVSAPSSFMSVRSSRYALACVDSGVLFPPARSGYLSRVRP